MNTWRAAKEAGKGRIFRRCPVLLERGRQQKIEFLKGLTVLSVPATHGKSFGLYVIEALAAGVPVVQPRHAAFPELIEMTGGGMLCEPDDPQSLADGIAELLSNPEQRTDMAVRGREARPAEKVYRCADGA